MTFELLAYDSQENHPLDCIQLLASAVQYYFVRTQKVCAHHRRRSSLSQTHMSRLKRLQTTQPGTWKDMFALLITMPAYFVCVFPPPQSLI